MTDHYQICFLTCPLQKAGKNPKQQVGASKIMKKCEGMN